jgi:solute carrier family 39 (zinc transporter), member 1/2/3
MTIFVLFFIELMALRYASFSGMSAELGHDHNDGSLNLIKEESSSKSKEQEPKTAHAHTDSHSHDNHPATHMPGDDHMGHEREHQDIEHAAADVDTGIEPVESYAAQLTSLFILEFGVVFHSVFIGLTLAVSGKEFTTLYVVVVFHQMFEGLGLGSRLALTPFPRSKRWTPYVMGIVYGLTTPIAISIGLGVRMTYAPGSQTSLITNGVFDSISAGILIYTGLVELMAHEFLFSSTLRKAKPIVLFGAFGTMVAGAGKFYPSVRLF